MIKTILFWLILAYVGGYCIYIYTIPQKAPGLPKYVDGIVVLTGDKGRVEHGLNRLIERPLGKLLISGVGEGLTIHELLEVHPTKKKKIAPKLSKITLGDKATSTVENIEEIEEWVEEYRIKSIILITSNYHMPRSTSLAAWAFPDLMVYPDPVIVKTDIAWYMQVRFWHMSFMEYNKWLASYAQYQAGMLF